MIDTRNQVRIRGISVSWMHLIGLMKVLTLLDYLDTACSNFGDIFDVKRSKLAYWWLLLLFFFMPTSFSRVLPLVSSEEKGKKMYFKEGRRGQHSIKHK